MHINDYIRATNTYYEVNCLPEYKGCSIIQYCTASFRFLKMIEKVLIPKCSLQITLIFSQQPRKVWSLTILIRLVVWFFFFFFFFGLFRACGASQARGRIRAVAASLCSATATWNVSRGSDLHHNSRQCYSGLLTTEPRWELHDKAGLNKQRVLQNGP